MYRMAEFCRINSVIAGGTCLVNPTKVALVSQRADSEGIHSLIWLDHLDGKGERVWLEVVEDIGDVEDELNRALTGQPKWGDDHE